MIRITCISLFLLFQTGLLGQNMPCDKAKEVVFTMNKYHMEPRNVNDDFSALVFDHMLDVLDGDRMIFSKEDVASLSVHKAEIDDQINNGTCDFLEDVSSMFAIRLNKIDSLLTILKSSEYDFKSSEVLALGENIEFLETKKLNILWKNLIQVEILRDLIDADTLQGEITDLESKFQAALDLTISGMQCRLKTRFDQKSVEDLVAEKYLQSVCFAFDPHSTYFSDNGKSNFDNALSEQALGFGFKGQPLETGYLEISDLMPGGAAWKSNQLNPGDIILSMEGNNIVLDLKCISTIALNEFLRDDKILDVKFRVRKRNMEEIDVFLTKEALEVESNIIQSFILEADGNKIGYLYLPSFYSNTSEFGMLLNGCANDIAKELIKLKKENIEGLIFDVRDNGGGFMFEAIRLSGIFIDYGALAITHERGQEPSTLKDPSRGTSYDGPMVVMVNGYSASASELFAAAMQDQNRALIVGSNTFGKATMQNVLPLESVNGVKRSDEFLKITLGKFYRVTGQSHQNEGVVVDISIPSSRDLLYQRENDYKSSLENGEIEKKTYFYPKSDLPIEKLKSANELRIDSSPVFQNILKLQKEYYKKKLSYRMPASYDALSTYLNEKYDRIDNMNLISEILYEAKKPSYAKLVFDADNEENSSVMDGINNDEAIKESYRILIDQINLK